MGSRVVQSDALVEGRRNKLRLLRWQEDNATSGGVVGGSAVVRDRHDTDWLRPGNGDQKRLRRGGMVG